MQNREAKARLGYKHPKSLVRFDGSEKLVGQDWKKRKQELWDRAGGRCERITGQRVIFNRGFHELTGETVRCKSEGHDPHHVIARSRHRDDRLENLQLLCRLHHDLLDKRKVRWTKNEAA